MHRSLKELLLGKLLVHPVAKKATSVTDAYENCIVSDLTLSVSTVTLCAPTE